MLISVSVFTKFGIGKDRQDRSIEDRKVFKKLFEELKKRKITELDHVFTIRKEENPERKKPSTDQVTYTVSRDLITSFCIICFIKGPSFCSHSMLYR